ncbi:hypothetical protein HHX48_01640 [Salinimonas sp. HHU 13199]|uniref:Uncharacterized protein n=1 Tax=Salinimonas profundi TaxID=2729140 RepID=A0ABR8LDP8_9ALTE|nr:hypothetical protein [Salinimonas profundi]MBD3584431.1 hypothetical protein [Salinimonas profundi]
MRRTVTILLTSITALSSPVAAQQADDDIENIEVIGQKPLSLYFEIRNEKRVAFMQMFNKLVDNKDLAFTCKRRTRRNSHIKHEVCKNNYEWRIYQEIMQDEINRGNVMGASAVAEMGNAEQRKLKKKLVIKIQETLASDAAFREIYRQFKAADRTYKKAHVRKFGVLSPAASKDNED